MSKILTYISTYILMLFIGVGGVFLFTDRSSPSEAIITQSEPTAIEKVVTSLTSSKSMSLGGEFDLSLNSENLAKISLDIDLNMLDGFSDLAMQGTLGILKQDSEAYIDFVYVNNQVYLSMLGSKLVIETTDISDLINIISSLVETVVPEFDLSSMLDLATLMDLMYGIQESEGEDNIILSLPTDLGDINIITDLDYKIKEISIPNIVLDTLSIVPKISLSVFDDFQNIIEPSDQDSYDNISEEINLLKAVINTLSNDFVAQGSLSDVDVNLIKSQSDLNLNLTYFDYNLNLTMYQNTAYLSLGDFKVKVDETDVNYMVNYVTDLFDYGQGIDIEEILQLLLNEFKTLDLSSVDLSQITEFIEKDNDKFNITIGEYDLTIEVAEDRITKIFAQIGDNTLELQFEYTETQIQSPLGQYVTLATLIKQVDAIANTFTSDFVNIKANISYNELDVELDADYAYNVGELIINSNIKFLEFNVNLIFENNVLYFCYQGLKIKADKTTLDKLLSYVEIYDSSSAKDVIILIVDFIDNLTLNGSDNNLNLINGDFELAVTLLDDQISAIVGTYKDLNISAEFTYDDFDKQIIDESSYTNANELIDLAENTYQTIQNGVTLEVLVEYADLSINGTVSYVDESIFAELTVIFGGVEAEVEFQNNVVYVELLGAKLKFDLADIDNVLNSFAKMGLTFNDNIMQMLDLSSVIALIENSYISYDNGTFTLTMDDFLASVETSDDRLSKINLSYLDAIISTQVREEAINVELVDAQEYLDLVSLLPLIESMYNTYNQNNIYGQAVIECDLNNCNYSLTVDFNIGITDTLKVWASVQYEDMSLQVYYIDNVVYIAVENIYVKANLQDVDKLTEYFGDSFELNGEEIVTIVKEILNVLSIQDLSFVNSINSNQNNLSMNLGSGQVIVEFTDVINYLCVEFNSLNVDADIHDLKLEAVLSLSGESHTIPDGEYIDINDLIDVADKAVDTFGSSVSGEIVVTIHNDDATKILDTNQLNATYNYAYIDSKINFNMSMVVLGDTLNVTIKNNTLYLDYQGIKVYSSVEDLLSLVPSNNSIDIENILFTVVKQISLKYIDNSLVIGLNNTSIKILNGETLLSGIELESEILDAKMSIDYCYEYSEPILSSDYVEVQNLIALIENAFDVLSGNIYAEFSANLFGYELIGAVNYQDCAIQIDAKIANRDVEIKLIDSTIYINFDDLKFKFKVDDVDKVVNLLEKYELVDTDMNICLEDNFISKILNNLYLTYDGNNILASVNYDLQDFNVDLSGIDLSILGIDLGALQANQINVLVDGADNRLNGLDLTIGEMLSVEVVLYGNERQIDDNIAGYLDIIELLPFVEPFISAYLSSGICGEISVNIPNLETTIGSLNIDYKVNFNAGLIISLSTNIMNLPVEVNIVNNSIYIKIDEAKYYFALDDLESILTTIEEKFSIELSGINLNDFNLGDVTIEVLNDNILQIQYNDIVLYIVNETELKIALEYNGIDVQATIEEGLNAINSPEGDYLHIDSLLNKVMNIYDIIQDGNINIKFTTNIENQPLEILASIDFNEFINTLNVDDLVINAVITAFDKQISVKMVNSTIYVSVDGFNVKLEMSDIDTIIEFINDNIIEIALPNAEIDLNTLMSKLYTTGDNIVVELNNIGTIEIGFTSEQLKYIDVISDSFEAKVEVISDNIDVILQKSYSNVVDLLPVADTIIDIYNSKKLSFDAVVNMQLLDNNQEINVSANIDFEDSLKIDLHLTLEGVEVSVYVRDDVLYLDIYGLRIKLTEQDLIPFVEFVNNNFNTNLVVPSMSDEKGAILLEFINSNLNLNIDTSFDLSMIGTWSLSDYILYWTLGNGAIINIDTSSLMDVNFSYSDTYINLSVIALSEGVILQTFDKSQYVQVQEILSSVQAIINTLNIQQYNLNANAQVYNNDVLRFDAHVNADLSIIDGIYFSGSAELTGESDIAVNVDYDNEYFYLDYDGLKLKINNQNLLEIAGIVLSVFGIDISGLDIFKDIDLNFDLNNLEQIMPSIDFGNPLSMLQIINSLSYENGQFNLALNGSFITGDDSSQIMNVSIITLDDQLYSVELTGIYTSDIEYFDLQILFGEFTEINAVEGNYIDISSASSLIKGLINTSELLNYHITGTINIVMDVVGVNIDWDVPYDIQIKLVDGKPLIKASVGPMPVVPAVNNDVPYVFGDTVSGIYCGLNRVLTVYYMDGYVYFYRTEEVPVFASSNRTYEKKLKASINSVLEDPMTYLQYALGLTDTIMDAISDAMALAENREEPIDLGNILLSYDYSDEYYNLTINLAEISNNPQLDTMTVNIKTSYIESAEKDYTTDLKFNLHAPFTDSIVMDLTTEDMQLVDIGENLDFSDLYEYINNYTYDEDAQWEASNGSWSLSSAITYTISFVTNSDDEVESIAQAANTSITLPSLSNKTVEDGDIRYTYAFDGWYTTEDCTDGTEFTQNTMPRGDTTLYAKWSLVSTEYTRTITFETNGGSAIDDLKFVAGTEVDLSSAVPTKDTTYVDEGYNWVGSHAGKWTYEVTTYTFAGWYTDESLETAFSGVMPDENITLYAKWTTSTTTEYYYSWECP